MSTKFISIALLLYLTGNLVGCAPLSNISIPVFWGTIDQDHYSGIHAPLERVIQTQKEWDDFSEQHASRVSRGRRTIDFTRFSIIAVFLGERTDGRYSVQITSIAKAVDHMTVAYREFVAGEKCTYPTVTTYPYHIIGMEHFELPVQFQKRIEAYDCTNPVPFRTIEQGANSNIYDAFERVIQTPKEWLDFWQKHKSGQTPQPPLPTVDFTHETVISVFVGGRTSGGYLAEITSTLLDENRVIVTYKEVIPGDYCGVATIVTQPYHIVRLKRTDLPVLFQKLTEIHDCPRVP